MNINACDIVLIGGFFTVIGAFIGALTTYFFALKLAKLNAKREAGRRLREVFAPELSVMDPSQVQNNVDVEELLQSAFQKHKQAINEFAFYIKGKEKKRFIVAWEKYYMVGGSVRFFDYYIGNYPRQLFKDRVNTILKFTEI